MVNEPDIAAEVDGALRPFPAGKLTRLASGSLQVDIAADAGGRIAGISRDGLEWLVGHDANPAMIAWGCYPMLPWAGRIRRGRFDFAGRQYQLPGNLEGHAIHGVGFGLPWQIMDRQAHRIELSLELPRDERWPFGGIATHRVELTDDALRCHLSLQAGEEAMPWPVLGWHPWFVKPDRLEFHPQAFYRRDAEGIAVGPTVAPPPGPWDDCFVNHAPVLLHRGGKRLRLTSDCSHWVVYDQPDHATCVEPQTGPPDAFNLESATLPPHASIHAWFAMEWCEA
ncbi:aldose epimerase [Lysobacter sp. Root494]|nr:aldose epimerase [Lysobacter sp. Root494]